MSTVSFSVANIVTSCSYVGSVVNELKENMIYEYILDFEDCIF
jgi:hypothetical protein